MRKRIYVLSAIALLLLLSARIIFRHIHGVKEEKKWYVSQLHFNFSGKIDSLRFLNKRFGLIFFHITAGYADRSVEEKLNEQLKFNGEIKFIFIKGSDETVIPIGRLAEYAIGDSIHVDTDKNNLTVYRGDSAVSSVLVSQLLSGRPF